MVCVFVTRTMDLQEILYLIYFVNISIVFPISQKGLSFDAMISFVCDHQLSHVVLLQRTICIVFALMTMPNMSPILYKRREVFFFDKTGTNKTTCFSFFAFASTLYLAVYH